MSFRVFVRSVRIKLLLRDEDVEGKKGVKYV